MAEQWSVEDWHEYQRTGKTPNRDRATDTAADVEPASSDAPLAEKKGSRFDSRVNITVISYRKRPADPDGISAKYAIDGLVMSGLLRDDGPEFVEEVRYRQEKSKVEKTQIIIEEV